MKACGIVTEYNPFHNGHAYQIEQIRNKLPVDVVIAVMSGNFLQRGEPAIVDKWTRTKMALAAGVDLVVELPVSFSTQPADFFAKGAIQILGDLKIDFLSFGVEEGSGVDFLKAATWMIENESLISREMIKRETMNVPYAKQMAELLNQLAPRFPIALNSPNNQLGFAYAKEIVRQDLAEKIELFPIQRKAAGYNDPVLNEKTNIASATAIRKALLDDREIEAYIPSSSYLYLLEEVDQMVTWDDYFPYLKYQLLIQSEASLRNVYQMTEGLEYRLKQCIKEAFSMEEFLECVKTKRYTRTRLQRLLTYVLLQLSQEEVEKNLNEIPVIRLLGFNKTGQRYLNETKSQFRSPLISNINQKTKNLVKLDTLAGEIYTLGNKKLKKQDFTRHPIKFD